MELQLAIQGRQDLAGQIYRQLRSAILDGRLAPEARLPSTRDLAAQLGVSRKTTLEAYERLTAEGYLAHLAGPLAPWLEPVVPAAGIHLVARLRQPLAEAPVIDAAREVGIGLYGLAPFHAGPRAEPGLLFGYGGLNGQEIDTALARLATLLPKLSSRQTAPD